MFKIVVTRMPEGLVRRRYYVENLKQAERKFEKVYADYTRWAASRPYGGPYQNTGIAWFISEGLDKAGDVIWREQARRLIE